MPISLVRFRALGLSALAVAVASLVGLAAAQQSSAAPACAALLTADEIAVVVGERMDDMGPQDRGEGESLCAWMLRGGKRGFATVTVTYYEPAALAGGNISTLDGLYDEIVSGAEGVAAGKRQTLTGIAVRAAFVPTDPQVFVAVQLPGGVARIVANNLTREQITALARAVAAP